MAAVDILLNAGIDPASIGRITQQLAALSNKQINLSVNTRGLSQVTGSVSAYSNAIRGASEDTLDFASRVGMTAKRLMAFYTASILITGALRGMSAAFSQLVEIEQSVNKLTQIFSDEAERTGKSASEMARKVSSDVLNMGKAYGASAKDVLSMVNVVAQAGEILTGKGMKDLESTVEALVKTKNLATFGNLTDTTRGLTAALSQFNLTAQDSKMVLDLANQSAKTFAVDASDIMEGVRRAGSALNEAGADFGEYVALMTAVKSSTQLSTSEIATAFKTLSIRAIDPKNLQKMDDALRKTSSGMKGIYDKNGELRDTVSIWKDLADGISNLDPTEARRLLGELSGLRQISVMGPLFKDLEKGNQSTYFKTIQENAKAVGSVARDAIVAQKSLQNITNEVGIALSDLYKKIGEDESFKEMAKNIADMMSGAIGFVKAISGAIPIITRLGVVIAGIYFGPKIVDKLGIKNIPNAVKGAMTFGHNKRTSNRMMMSTARMVALKAEDDELMQASRAKGLSSKKAKRIEDRRQEIQEEMRVARNTTQTIINNKRYGFIGPYGIDKSLRNAPAESRADAQTRMRNQYISGTANATARRSKISSLRDNQDLLLSRMFGASLPSSLYRTNDLVASHNNSKKLLLNNLTAKGVNNLSKTDLSVVNNIISSIGSGKTKSPISDKLKKDLAFARSNGTVGALQAIRWNADEIASKLSDKDASRTLGRLDPRIRRYPDKIKRVRAFEQMQSNRRVAKYQAQLNDDKDELMFLEEMEKRDKEYHTNSRGREVRNRGSRTSAPDVMGRFNRMYGSRYSAKRIMKYGGRATRRALGSGVAGGVALAAPVIGEIINDIYSNVSEEPTEIGVKSMGTDIAKMRSHISSRRAKEERQGALSMIGTGAMLGMSFGPAGAVVGAATGAAAAGGGYLARNSYYGQIVERNKENREINDKLGLGASKSTNIKDFSSYVNNLRGIDDQDVFATDAGKATTQRGAWFVENAVREGKTLQEAMKELQDGLGNTAVSGRLAGQVLIEYKDSLKNLEQSIQKSIVAIKSGAISLENSVAMSKISADRQALGTSIVFDEADKKRSVASAFLGSGSFVDSMSTSDDYAKLAEVQYTQRAAQLDKLRKNGITNAADLVGFGATDIEKERLKAENIVKSGLLGGNNSDNTVRGAEFSKLFKAVNADAANAIENSMKNGENPLKAVDDYYAPLLRDSAKAKAAPLDEAKQAQASKSLDYKRQSELKERGFDNLNTMYQLNAGVANAKMAAGFSTAEEDYARLSAANASFMSVARPGVSTTARQRIAQFAQVEGGLAKMDAEDAKAGTSTRVMADREITDEALALKMLQDQTAKLTEQFQKAGQILGSSIQAISSRASGSLGERLRNKRYRGMAEGDFSSLKNVSMGDLAKGVANGQYSDLIQKYGTMSQSSFDKYRAGASNSLDRSMVEKMDFFRGAFDMSSKDKTTMASQAEEADNTKKKLDALVAEQNTIIAANTAALGGMLGAMQANNDSTINLKTSIDTLNTTIDALNKSGIKTTIDFGKVEVNANLKGLDDVRTQVNLGMIGILKSMESKLTSPSDSAVKTAINQAVQELERGK